MEAKRRLSELMELINATDPDAVDQLMLLIREWARLNPRKEVRRLKLVSRNDI